MSNNLKWITVSHKIFFCRVLISNEAKIVAGSEAWSQIKKKQLVFDEYDKILEEHNLCHIWSIMNDLGCQAHWFALLRYIVLKFLATTQTHFSLSQLRELCPYAVIFSWYCYWYLNDNAHLHIFNCLIKLAMLLCLK